MTKSNLKVVEGAPPEAPAERSPARARLAEAIGQRPAMAAEVAAIEAAQKRLASLIVAESRAASAISALEAAAAETALAWARAGQSDPPSIANGGDLIGARETLVEMQMQAEAARRAEPQLQGEMQRALSRRAALEETIRGLVREVLLEQASSFAAWIAELERKAGAETAKLAALRRPIMRLSGQDAMAARRSVAPVDALLGERPVSESEVRALEPAFQRLAEDLIGDASATLGGNGS
jgi:hypothetical protein